MSGQPIKEIEDLETRGFDVELAMNYCINDEGIYREVLQTALDEGKEKIELIKQLEEQEDVGRFQIELHGLKNAAKQIGAIPLSEQALALENAAKENNLETIHRNISDLIVAYRDILQALEELFENS